MPLFRPGVEQITIPVRVKIQQQTARFQHPHPLGIGRIGMGEVPCEVPGNHHIEAAVRKGQLFSVHPAELDPFRQSPRVFQCLCQHGVRVVHGRHLVAQFRQDDGKKARPGSNLQNADVIPAPPSKMLPDPAV